MNRIKKFIISLARNRWVVFYIILLTGIIYLSFSHWAYDDPFITYRYAFNLSHGLGFVYNPGVRVLSSTTPLFAILLAFFDKLGADLPHIAILLGAVGIALGGIFLWDLARSWNSDVAGWSAPLLYPTFILVLLPLSSETPFYLALCLGAFAFYARKNYRLAAIFTGLAVLTRADAGLVAVILAADYLFRERRPIPWSAVILFLGLTLPWFVISWLYFGSPIPVTLAAKQHQASMTISQNFAANFPGFLRGYFNAWEYWLEAALAAVGVIYTFWRARPWFLFLSWTALYFIAYSILRVSGYFWYYAPLVPGFIVLVGLGITALNSPGKALYQRLRLSASGRIPGIAFLAFSLALILYLPLVSAQLQNDLQLRQNPDRRYPIYRSVGLWLNENTPPDAAIGALEVGIIGYYAQRYMVDFAGLIQPDIAGKLSPQTTYEDAALWAVGHYQPDYLVLHNHLFTRLEQGYVAQRCQPLKEFPGATYNYSMDLVVYSCRRGDK